MMVELQGASAVNKGAHLMALACIGHFAGTHPPTRCCLLPQHPGTGELPLARIFPQPARKKGLLNHAANALRARVSDRLLPERDRDLYGLVRRQDVDALLDISGYAYGDPWRKSLPRVELAETYHRLGKRVVFMPQMFGPFEDRVRLEEFCRLVDAADLVYARDRTSYELARRSGADITKIEISPDITIDYGCPGEAPRPFSGRSYACIIPNEKLLSKRSDEWGGTYVDRLRATGQQLLAMGLSVAIVVHESAGEDLRLASGLAQDLRHREVHVVSHPDPVELKLVLSRSLLVIGSRFHGLVAALSTATPAIALGWAHKYEALQSDFGVRELQHRGDQEPAHLQSLVQAATDERHWSRIHETLLEHSRTLRTSVRQMWQRVDEVLGVATSAMAPSS